MDQRTRYWCCRTISSCNPPITNIDNCNCLDTRIFQAHQSPPSFTFASSASSASFPKGHESQMISRKTYLPLAPEAELDEFRHRRPSSFDDRMSYQIRRFLVDPATQRPTGEHDSTSSAFKVLQQDIHIQLLKSAGNGNKRRKLNDFGWIGCASISRGPTNSAKIVQAKES